MHRSRFNDEGPLRVRFTLTSENRKTGPIPVTLSSPDTCPSTCPLYGNGCYAEHGYTSLHWSALGRGEGEHLDWDAFLRKIVELPEGQLWRHNEAGDLPGRDTALDYFQLMRLAYANKGRRGFTYTHKPATPNHVHSVKSANEEGFTINWSADSLEQADQLADLKAGPVVVVMPHDYVWRNTDRTPAGRHVVLCPAERFEKVNCSTCKMCQVVTRKSIVAFRAHGSLKQQITTDKRQLKLFP